MAEKLPGAVILKIASALGFSEIVEVLVSFVRIVAETPAGTSQSTLVAAPCVCARQ